MEKFFQYSKVYSLKDSIEYSDGAIVSKIITKESVGNVSLFAFDKEQSLSEHTAPFDAIVYILEGTGIIGINKVSYEVKAGEMIIMPANVPHYVFAKERFKMLLVMIKK
jgi:quercetin dioxygenase-like cupin family protein